PLTTASAALPSGAVRSVALGLLGMATVEVVTRAFSALHDTRTPVKMAALGMLVNLALGITLVRVLGLNGLALAMAVASTVEGAALFLVGQRRLPGLRTGQIAGTAATSLISALLMGAVVLAFQTLAAPLVVPLAGLILVA